MSTQNEHNGTEHSWDAAMHLLAEGTPISLLMDLFDPTGPHSEDLLAHEHLAHEHLAHEH